MDRSPGEELPGRLVLQIGELRWVLDLPQDQHLDQVTYLSKERQRFGIGTTAHYPTSCVSVNDPPLSDPNGRLEKW
jgi:hypothetical protein